MHYAPPGTDVRPGVWDSHPLKTYQSRHWKPSRERISATTSRGCHRSPNGHYFILKSTDMSYSERSDSAPRFGTGQHLFYKSLRRNTPDSCLQLPSLRFPPSTFEEGVQGIVRIRIPVLAFRTRDLPHSVKVEAETTVPSEKLGKVEVYLSMLPLETIGFTKTVLIPLAK
ncbi:hypothetical protein J6590_089024 [Homalodisca vitripennis]|nr:hypothetical protein J6590_089024 [Homalodisca vitripennis]